MAVTVTRTTTAMIGTPASPSTIAAAGTASGTVDLTSPAGVIEATIEVEVQVGASIPTTNITVRLYCSMDGTNYLQDGGDIVFTPVASTNYDFRYDPNPSAKNAKVSVINGATNSVTAFAQANTLAVS